MGLDIGLLERPCLGSMGISATYAGMMGLLMQTY